MARPRPAPGCAGSPLVVAFVVVAAVAGLLCPAAAADGDGGKTEGEVLVAFRDTLHGADGASPRQLGSWGTPGPCQGNLSSWHGVSCHENGVVQGLQLERLNLTGAAPNLSSLAVLPGLRVISLSDNALAGAFPDVAALGVLKMLYLSRNRLSGVIPDDTFKPMRGLRKLHLTGNDFSGPVPSSITSPRLLELSLAHNHFDGQLPDFSQPELRFVDVSGNNFSGPIPAGLGRFNATMFQGNKFLCGKPLAVACEPLALATATSTPTATPEPAPDGMSKVMIVAIVLIVLAVLLVAAGIATGVLCRRRRRRRRRALRTDGSETLANGEQTPSNPVLNTAPAVNINKSAGGAPAKRGPRRDEHGRLVFIQENRARFEIEDMLKASAEVLGSGNFGSSYKATFTEGSSVVVKRFKDMNGVGREDFSEHMRRLGRLSHPNLIPVVAYLYKKDEKLLITDYVSNGSLAQILHSNRGSILDWGKRLGIIKGAARGLAHLYDELPMLTVPHGHLKSSNVLLDGKFRAVLSDYALVPVLTAHQAAKVMVAYKAPECVAASQGGKPSKKSDVWSFGILILEVLTGKFPANYLRPGRQETTDIAGWVSSAVAEGRTSEAFDKDMAGSAKGSEEEMLKLLQVALACCDADVGLRLDLKTAVARIEEIKEPAPAPAPAGEGDHWSSSLTNDGDEPRRP